MTLDANTSIVLSVGALALGPILAGLLHRRSELHGVLDGFILIMVGGLALLHLLPHARESIGAWCLLWAVVGALLPLYAERRLHRRRGGESAGVLWLAMVGLILHASLDGAALAAAQHTTAHADMIGEHWSLPMAILLHRLPVGLLVWWSVRPRLGTPVAVALLAAVAGATFVGYRASSFLLPLAEGPVSGILISLLAGGLLHVVLDHHHHDEHCEEGRRPNWAALGALVALSIFFLLPNTVPPVLQRGFRNMGYLFVESSFAIVLGFLGAGLLTMVPARSLKRLLRGNSEASTALKGILFGLPLPICSCGVVPLYRGLHARGVPAAAATAFLVATPELGIDSVLISIPLLGLRITVVRLLAAFLVALAAGLVAGRVAARSRTPEQVEPAPPPPPNDLRGALDFGFRELFDDLGPWILAGILVAGLMEPLLVEGLLSRIPSLVQVPLFGVIATPFYICASGATPIAAVFLAKGASVGAVLAFLLTGPATNVTTYGAIRSVHRGKAAWIVLLTVPAASILLGWLMNLVPGLSESAPPLDRSVHGIHWWQKLGVVLFGLLLVSSLVRRGPRELLSQIGIGRLDEVGGAHHHRH